MICRAHRSVASVATIAFLLGTIGCADSTEPQGSGRLGTRYAVEFPVAPVCSQAALEDVSGKARREVCIHFDSDLGLGYSSEIFALPGEPSRATPAEILLAAAAGAAASTDSDIIKSQNATVGSFPALDVTLYPKAKGFVAFSRYILVDSELITVTADGYKTREAPADASAFLNSVRVLP
jgi:hypothetical protein